MQVSLVEQLFRCAKFRPNHVALIVGSEEITYDSLIFKIWSTKCHLEANWGVKKGDSVILSAEKSESFVFLYYALQLLGVKVIPLDSGTSSDRLAYIISCVKPSIVIGLVANPLEGIVNLDLNEFQNVPHHSVPDDLTFPVLSDVADIMFTSGTTGEPKGVILTQENIAQSAENINGFIGNTCDDIELLALPISHSFGIGRLRCVFKAGGTLLLEGNSVNVKRLFRKIEEFKVTGFSMVPSSWKYIKRLSGLKIGQFRDQLKYIELGSAYLSPQEKYELAELLPKTRLCMHYGLTEASRSTFLEFNGDKDRIHTVGRACGSVEIKIFDESGLEMPKGQEGEICISGRHVARSFINSSDASFFHFEYYRTGDIGIIDELGYLELKGRANDIINVGGKKLSPIEVEDRLKELDSGIEVACVGVLDNSSILGEEVKLFIVEGSTAMTLNDINMYLKEKIEDYKVPRYYEWISELPRTSSGKIQRQKLR